MQTIGVLGGMSWESTESYYRALNQGVKASLGGFHSAKIVMVSVDFAEIEALQRQGDWPAMGQLLAEQAQRVQAAGADLLLLATNTMHKVAPQIEEAIDIPLLHIADTTGERLVADGRRRVGLLGTRFTMEEAFYTERLTERFGIETVVPDEGQRQRVHDIIFDELCQGRIDAGSRTEYLNIIGALRRQGVEAVILGCTEIALLVSQVDTVMPLYDTTALHAGSAVARALEA
ncbi:aspartate/glutamate racemase family protein [Halomonas sabkhae]|uniref:aspartate/glutamate racemase family protein n=1 Tax=Halomonas sabkhae TaxID=626223 RepID=UPI0025B2E717|nr:aspartate/glutamate racemase family protein [Halomonas sabkhae]MDN3526009.1 aspartate/glutamate racemase family protein [Halomonas sabkhae]